MKTVYLHGSPDYYGSGKVLLEILHIPGNAENAMVIFPHEGPLCTTIRSMGIPLYIINMGVLRRKYSLGYCRATLAMDQFSNKDSKNY
jgi:hypothetical protein